MDYLDKLGMYRRAVAYFLTLFSDMEEDWLCYLAELTIMYHENSERFK